MADEPKTIAEQQAAKASAETAAVKEASKDALQTLGAALAGVDLEALKKSAAGLAKVVSAFDPAARFAKAGHVAHAAHGQLFDQARGDLHLAQAGAAQALDALGRFKTKLEAAGKAFEAAEKAKEDAAKAGA